MAKIDKTEVFADWRFSSGLILAAVLGMMTTAGAALANGTGILTKPVDRNELLAKLSQVLKN